jgi:predicted DNA-binding transcriptional regulator YafY
VAVFPQIERLFWFHDRVKAGRFPNANRLAEQFEISPKTAQRDITRLRDRLLVPLEYNAARKGYYYTDDHFELPYLPASQQEILCLLLARKVLSQSAQGYISREIASLMDKLYAAVRSAGLTPQSAENAFSATWIGYTPALELVFRQTAFALLKRQLIRFTYRSPATDKLTTRTAEPHHLQHYMASWVLTAWCRKRRDWRKFYLARMTDLEVLTQNFEPKSESQWRPLLDSTFGLFQGGPAVPITLRFCPFRARWIRQQQWHPDQCLSEQPDGCLDLTVPVSDFREIKLQILQFGADVEVISPEALRREVMAEIEKMGRLYQQSPQREHRLAEKKSGGGTSDV